MQALTAFFSLHFTLFMAALVTIALLMLVEFVRVKRNTTFCIDTTEAVRLINHHQATVIDLRPNDAFRHGHILAALSLSAKEVLASPKKLEKIRKKMLILVCSNGSDSQKTAPLLAKQGYNVKYLSGGIRAWTNAGMPLLKE